MTSIKVKQHHITLTLVDDKKVKKCYWIEDSRSLHIFYNPLTNNFIVEFKENKHEVAVFTKHFHVTGCTYANEK